MTIRSLVQIICSISLFLTSCAPSAGTTTAAVPGSPDNPPRVEKPEEIRPPREIPQWVYPIGYIETIQTSFPAVSCALTDNRPTQNLLAAIQKLSDAVRPKQDCAGDVDFQRANDQVTRLAESVKGLNQFWQYPELLAQGNNMAQFQTLLESAIRGIDTVGRNFTGNGLLNSKCAKGNMGVADVFIAFTDLVTAFAPFALIGASMNPSLGVALPYVLGITGAGSAAKIVNRMLREQGLDTSQPEVRNAILQNICEYMKIAEKVRFLKLAQSGQLEFVTREISTSGTQRLFQLYSIQPPHVKTLIHQRNLFLAQLESVKETFPKDQSELVIFKMEMQGVVEKPMICEMSRTMMNVSGDQQRFPGRAIANFKKLIDLQVQPSLGQEALMKSEASLRAQFNSIGTNPDLCAQVGQSYIETVSRIVTATGDLYRNVVAANNTELSKRDKEFGLFSLQESKAKKEIETISKVTSILQKLNQDNAVIDKVEMHSQMLNLKRALFSKPTDLVNRATRTFSWIGIEGVGSPALEYLNFISDQQVQTISLFAKEMNALMDDVMYHKPLYDEYVRNRDGSIKKDSFGHPVRKSLSQITDESMRAIKERSDLSIITAKTHPTNSDAHVRMCQRLENIWLSWASVMDHLAAQSFFCSQIRSLFDGETDKDLVKRCDGRFDITGKQTAKSGIQEKQSELAQPQHKGRALLISEKLRELNCRMPDGLTIMQGI